MINMKTKVLIEKHPIYNYYIQLFYNGEMISRDAHIAKILDFDVEEYQNLLFKFNANCKIIEPRKEMYFENEDDALQAIEWINSILIANKLISK